MRFLVYILLLAAITVALPNFVQPRQSVQELVELETQYVQLEEEFLFAEAMGDEEQADALSAMMAYVQSLIDEMWNVISQSAPDSIKESNY